MKTHAEIQTMFAELKESFASTEIASRQFGAADALDAVMNRLEAMPRRHFGVCVPVVEVAKMIAEVAQEKCNAR